jgi:CRISPR system Cascade subunit CasB
VKKRTYEHPYVSHLIDKISADRAARAVLRRTLGREAGDSPEAFRYVVPWLPNACSERVEDVYYLVAGLFAYHPMHTGEGNLGGHLRELAGSDEKAVERLERRLEAALRAHPDDLPDHLRRLVGILKSKDRPVNWHALMGDLLSWDNEDLRAKKRWAQAFWGRRFGGDETAVNQTKPDYQPVEEME